MTALLAATILPSEAQRGNPRIQFEGRGVDEMIADFMEQNDVPGLSVAIVQAPYITRASSYGLADPARRTLVSPNTVFDVGQMRHAYTAVAIMQLVEAGQLKLSDPLATFLPGEAGTVQETLLQPARYAVLERILRDRGVGIVARVDHRQAAATAKLDLRPTEELIFGNPALGTQLMQANPAAAIDLPLRAAAWEENGEVWLAATDPVEIARRNRIDLPELTQKMRLGIDSALLKAVSPE